MRQNYKKLIEQKTEAGVASIFVVMILMTVMALISVGFSVLMNRELRQALDRQLSAAAYYTAESGVNDARNYMTGTLADSFNGCDPLNTSDPLVNADTKFWFVKNGDISGDKVFKYTCVEVDAKPKALSYNLKQGETVLVPLEDRQLDNLHIGWGTSTATGYNPLRYLDGSAVPVGTLPREDKINLDSTGVLRATLYPVAQTDSAANTSNNITARQRDYFFFPAAGGSGALTSYNYSSPTGPFLSGNCNSSHTFNYPFALAIVPFCNAKITNILVPSNGFYFYLRLTALYSPMSVTIEIGDTSDKARQIHNAEAQIDVTGSGNDVLRRVQAIVPINQNNAPPGYGIQSMQAVCKLFKIDVKDSNHYGDLSTEGPNDDGACAYPSGSNGATIDGSGGCVPIPGCPPICGGSDTCGGGGGGGGGGSAPSGCSVSVSHGGDFSASASGGCSGGTAPISYSWSWNYNWVTGANSCTGGGSGTSFSLSNPAGSVTANFTMIASNAFGSTSAPGSSGAVGVGGGNPCN